VRNTDEEGEALLLHSRSEEAISLRDPDSIPVRRFKDTDFKQALKRMGRGRGDHLVAMILLRIAMASKQQEDIKKAREKLCAAVAFNHQLGKRLNLRSGCSPRKEDRWFCDCSHEYRSVEYVF
jgi:hypothetical protein